MATTQHLEIEAKYDLPEGAALPDLLGVAGVREIRQLAPHVLTATYHDTADLALQRHGVTLRRRTGGTDDGWHLKLPVADGERLEVRRPLGTRPPVPLALRRLLVTVAGDEPLVPVATLVTHRAVHHLTGPDGTVLAELADDLVTVEREGAEPVRWRELEIELVDGDPAMLAALDKAVRGSGVKPSAASSKIGRVLAADARASVSWSPRLRSSAAADVLLAESAARLRVLDAVARAGRPGDALGLERGVRRRLAAADVAARLGRVPDPGADGPARELRWAAQALAGAARLDEAAALARETIEDQPPELVLGPVSRRLDREVAARRRAEQQSLDELLASARWRQLLAAEGDVDAPARASGRGPRLAKALPQTIAKTVRRLERRTLELSAATHQQVDERLAPAQRAAGAALLALDLASRAGARRSELAGHVEASADLLDRLAVVVRALDLVHGAGVAAHLAGENGFTFGRVHGLLAAEAATIARGLRAQRKALRRARRAG